jgi:glycosyltransferase involved in cell wall biosynthesis
VVWPGRTIVVRPPVFAAEYRTVPGDCVTLINLSEVKGGPVLFELARRHPHRRFLGVMGGYDRQLVPETWPANVEIVPHTARVVADVYRRTRVLLVPSRYEPWGRVAVEAASSGIPVVAHPALGLREALGDAGIFCDRDVVDEWTAALDLLDDPDQWRMWSERARARAEALDPTAELDLLETELARLASTAARV